MSWLLALWACAEPPRPEQTPPPASVPPTDTAPLEPAGIIDARAELHEEFETLVRVTWIQVDPADVYVTFRANEGEWLVSPTQSVAAGPAEQILLGVPYDADVEWRIVSKATTDASGSGTIRTGVWPETLPVPVVQHNDPTLWDPSQPYLITSMNHVGQSRYGRWWVFIMDRAGQIVWAQDTPSDWVSRHVSVSADRRALLVDRDTMWVAFDLGADSTVVRMTLDGEIHHTYATPGLHHAFLPLEDGVIAWPAKNGSTSETLEKVDLDGVQTRVWDCQTWHNDIGVSQTCGSNGIFWDPSTDHFLISFWSTDTVVEIDHPTGQALRWFGDLPGSWAFDPPASQFWWQHGPTYTDSGTLMVSSKDEEHGIETVVREYTLDEATQTLVEVWNFGESRGIYGEYMGEAHRAPNGNTLHIYGAGGHMVEAMPDGTVAWEVDWGWDKHNGRTTPFEDLYRLLSAE